MNVEPHRRTQWSRVLLQSEQPIRVALAEDDDELRCVLADALVSEGLEVSFLPDGLALMEHLAQAEREGRSPDVLVLDHHMPGMEGLEVLRRLRRAGSRLPVVVVTGFGAEVRARAGKFEACTVHDKPIDLDCLLDAVRSSAGRPSKTRPGSHRASGDTSPDPACAACNGTEYVRFHDTLAGVYFCIDCWRRSAPPDPYDDIGGSG